MKTGNKLYLRLFSRRCSLNFFEKVVLELCTRFWIYSGKSFRVLTPVHLMDRFVADLLNWVTYNEFRLDSLVS